MTDAELLEKLRSQLHRAAGYESDELATDRERAMDYYLMRPNGTEVTGRSSAVSGDVSAMVESNLAAMMEAFGDKHIARFDAAGPEDEDQAALESDAVTYMVMCDAGGRWHLAQAIKETLQLRNGWVKVWCEERRTASIDEYRKVKPEALLELTERPGVETKVLKYDPDDGYLKLRRVRVDKKFRAEAVAAENMLYPKQYDGCTFEALQAIPVIAERHIDTRSDLVRMGFSKTQVDRLKVYTADGNSTAAARNPRKDNALTPGLDASSESVEWLEVYALLDGGDGIAERQKICCDAAFKELLAREAAPTVVYATGQCFIAPHRLTGISLWDKLRQTQDINTALTRALLDNVQATSKSRLAYLDGKANPDDIADGRVNGAIRVKSSVARVSDAVMPFVVPDTSSGVREAINHQRGIRTELGGASLDMQTAQVQFNKQMGSEGLDRAYSVAEQLAAHMTQNVADTLVRSVFLIAHAVIREHFDQPLPVKRSSGRWEKVNPKDWQPRTSLTVNVGMSSGERMRRQASLDKLLQVHLTLEERGQDGILVDRMGFFDLLMEWARVADVPNPERYYIDPMSERSMKAAEAKAKQQAQTQAQQSQLVTQAVQIEKMGKALEKYKTDLEAAIEVWSKKVDAKIEYAKLGQAAEVAEMTQVMGAAKGALDAKFGSQGREESEGKPAAHNGAG